MDFSAKQYKKGFAILKPDIYIVDCIIDYSLSSCYELY